MKVKALKLFSLGIFQTASLVWLLPKLALAAQDPIERCKNFKAQFNGAFDWVPDTYCTANGIMLYAIQLALGLAGIVAVLFLILGGFWYLTSAGNEEQAEKGRKTLLNSVIGLIVIILAGTIVRIVANAITGG